MARIIIQLGQCLHFQKGCSRCIDECPMQLLKFDFPSQDGDITIEQEMCIECRNCEVTCPPKAIKVKSTE
jgi:NAD-dependent dihydropyrimidine dehydrogenase PreA subunit